MTDFDRRQLQRILDDRAQADARGASKAVRDAINAALAELTRAIPVMNQEQAA